MAVPAHFFKIAPKPSHPLYYFSIKWIQSLDITMEGGGTGPEGDCEAIGEAPLPTFRG